MKVIVTIIITITTEIPFGKNKNDKSVHLKRVALYIYIYEKNILFSINICSNI